jgi:hypothetical protein
MSYSKNFSLEKDSMTGILRLEYGDCGSCSSVIDEDLGRFVSTSLGLSADDNAYLSAIRYLCCSLSSSMILFVPFSTVIYLMTSTSFSMTISLITSTGFSISTIRSI